MEKLTITEGNIASNKSRKTLRSIFRKKTPNRIAIEKYAHVISYIQKEEANEIDLMIASTKAFLNARSGTRLLH